MFFKTLVFLPLIGSAIAGFFGRWIGDRNAQWITSGLVVLSALMSIKAFADVALGGASAQVEIFTWISSGDFEVSWALQIDTLTAVMLVVVTGVSALVHVYSIGYMSHDPHIPRFFSYLSLFTFAMLMLVTANNFLQLYFGWEGVGLASYLLIGFWYKKPSANAAAIKAFLVNRVGDFGFGLGILAIFLVFQSVDYAVVFAAAPALMGQTFQFLGFELDILTTICLLLFIGAMGKSAQLGLHTWLPDAMEGPTPVSALIHAATMVTAGVFMVARCSPLFEYAPVALNVVAVVGAATAFMAASIGLVQNDIKRVVAYSTCSQLGYMFFAAGVSAYGAAVFHLFTHAFFKALLFLGSGAVIHGLAGEQDMRKMGGIQKLMPLTWLLMLIGSLSLMGVPGFSGYFSKDMILESAFAAHSGVGQFAFNLGIAAAFMTAFYSMRLMFMTFHGKPNASDEVMKHAHDAPKVMSIPLVILAIGAVFAGWAFSDQFVGHGYAEFWRGSIVMLEEHNVLEAAHHVPTWVKWAPAVVAALGLWLAWLFYIRKPGLPHKLASANGPIYRFLFNKWYFDELYDFVFVRGANYLGRVFWRKGDGAIIDGYGPDGVAASVLALAKRARELQTGYLYHYAFAMLIGVAAFVSWYMIQGGAG
ncbi:MAG: NADH-quinone oxidoreductase subunit L [Sphingomonadales bacterium]